VDETNVLMIQHTFELWLYATVGKVCPYILLPRVNGKNYENSHD